MMYKHVNIINIHNTKFSSSTSSPDDSSSQLSSFLRQAAEQSHPLVGVKVPSTFRKEALQLGHMRDSCCR